MENQLKSQAVFHLTGRHADAGSAAVVAGLRPALLSAYRRLDLLRYDFPVVLAAEGDAPFLSVSSVVDAALRAVAPQGPAGEALRRRALQVEREIRRRVAGREHGTLSELWERAVPAVAAGNAAFEQDAARVREAIAVDGELADCDAAAPARLLRHAWSRVQRRKWREARERIDRLVIQLGNILRADRVRSAAALERSALQSTFGAPHHALFDFDSMSRLLTRGGPQGGLDARRRRRVEEALDVLESQRFFAPGGPSAAGAYDFEFEAPGAALAAFRERLPQLASLLKSLAVAELEVDGNYVTGLHDALYANYDAGSVTPEDLQFFPDYLVCLEAGRPGEQGSLAEALSAGVPLKLVVHVADLFEETGLGQGQLPFRRRAAQLASATLSHDDVFVLQSAASNLLQLCASVERGMHYPGPALFSIYAAPDGGAVSGYLRAAAAMQSRAFPAFSYDPAAGGDFAQRFSLENNPQPEVDWPVEPLAYADEDLQTTRTELAFTFADFALCDPGQAEHFEPVPRAAWTEGLRSVPEWLAQAERDPAAGLPCVIAVDDADLLCKLVVDERLVRATLRCREAWHRLQLLGGIRDSRTERLLARERQAWEEALQREVPTPAAAPAAVPAAAAASSGEPASAGAVDAEPAANPDEPHIETIRCSSCNECTQLNPRMFAYDQNKQAYIADLKAGTYRQLVEAAESCQLSIIHPGKPWDPSEPGLEELVERAQPFL